MLIVNHGKCVECSSCVNECHRKALKMTPDGIEWDAEKCYGCGHCMALCPRDALMLDGDGYNIMDVEEFNFAARPKEEQVREMIMMRRSVRSFTDNDVSEADLAKIIEAGKYSPTAENKQGNVFLVVTDPEKREEMLDDCIERLDKICDDVLADKCTLYSKTLAANLKEAAVRWREDGEDCLFYNAPVFIFVFSDTIQDGTIAACTMGNMAYGLRLGFCYIKLASDLFEDPSLRSKYNIPEGKVPAMAIAVGEPNVEFFCTVPRKDPDVIRL